jgi:ABC-type uncharacterized transport system involved in gliding motility auxiliary subunit
MFKKFFMTLLYVCNIIIYFAIVAIAISIPDEKTLLIGSCIFNLCLTAVLIIVDRKRYAKIYSGATFKYVVNAMVGTFLVFGILGLLNYLAFKHPRQIDFSEGKRNSLTEKTHNVLGELKDHVYFKVFSKKNDFLAIRKLLDLYRFQKNDMTIEHVNIETRPDLVQLHSITHPITIIVTYKEKDVRIQGDMSELVVTNALIKANRDKSPVIGYITGHNELQLDSKETDGGGYLSNLLKSELFDIQKINLLTVKQVPENIDVVMIWGPEIDFMKAELTLVDSFLKKGGRMIIGLDPRLKSDALLQLRGFLRSYEIDLPNNLVLDRISFKEGSVGEIPLIRNFDRTHLITKHFKGEVFFPLASSVRQYKADMTKPRGTFTSLAMTTAFPGSWGESNLSEIESGKVVFQEETDLKGPMNIMGLWEENKSDHPAKIMAFGNSSFVINAYSRMSNNFLLVTNSLSWLMDSKSLVSLNAPLLKEVPIFISAPQKGIIFYFSIIFAPLVLFIIAIVMYVRRERSA